jgi:hypothetical protein
VPLQVVDTAEPLCALAHIRFGIISGATVCGLLVAPHVFGRVEVHAAFVAGGALMNPNSVLPVLGQSPARSRSLGRLTRIRGKRRTDNHIDCISTLFLVVAVVECLTEMSAGHRWHGVLKGFGGVASMTDLFQALA